MSYTHTDVGEADAADGMSTFVQRYDIDGQHVELQLSEAVFQPTLTSRTLLRAMEITPGSLVLDIGCGSGILAVMAAKRGAGAVVATDIMPEACALARSNAHRNGVADRVSVVCGDLFESVPKQQFDTIISDVSGVADEVARISPWYPETIPTGGPDGADHIVRLLRAAPSFLRPGGTLYFATGTISNVGRTLEAARESFGNIEMMDEVMVPFCTELNENLDVMTRMKSEGIVDFTTRRSRRLWTLQIYRAWT